MIAAWRIVQASLAASAMDGEGAYMYGGRWNNPGTRVVYLSQSKSLAALEILVHADQALIGLPYSIIQVNFEEALCIDLDPLPTGWSNSDPVHARAAGDAWVASQASLALRVPSVVMPDEWNYLLNPAHKDIGKVAVDTPEEFRFDGRLVNR